MSKPKQRTTSVTAAAAMAAVLSIADPQARAAEILKREAGQVVYRSASFVVRAETIDEEKRTVMLAFASEAPVRRWYGEEILDCSAKSVRLGRLEDGGAVLFNHDANQLLGNVVSVEIGADRVLRALVRFDEDPEADRRFRQVLRGTLRHVSVGYVVHSMVLERESDSEGSVYRVDAWEPYEVTMTPVPADAGVGVGRAALELAEDVDDVDGARNLQESGEAGETSTPAAATGATFIRGEQTMTTQATTTPTAEALDIKRRDALQDAGVRYGQYVTPAEVQKACRDGMSVEDFQELIIRKMTTAHQDTRGTQIGMTDGEVQRYSVAKAVRSLISGSWKDAGLEREAHEAQAKAVGMESRGILLPWDVLARRDFTAGTAGEAGNLIATSMRTDLFADVLRNRLVMGRLGATMLLGLTGSVDMPRKSSGMSAGFVTEVAALSESAPGTSKVTMTPKRIGGYVEYSKQAVIQSALAVEPMLRADIFSEFQVQFEGAAVNGSGSGANPRGIRNTAGIGSVVGGTNGAQVTWAHVVGLESACANVNAEPDASSGYLVNTRTRGWLKQQQKAANLQFVWDNGPQPLNGYRAEVSNTVPSNLTKGTSSGVASSLVFSSNWPMFVLAVFGAVEILNDETSLAVNGLNRLILNAFVDTGCRRPADFATMDDGLTV